MVSVLRNLQAEWNQMVPQAQALGIRRVRPLNAPLETIEYRRGKVDWLRGELLRLQASTSLTQSPDLAALTFGVELEFIIGTCPRDELARRISAAGVTCTSESYNHTTGRAWKIVTDASVDSSYTTGFEIVSPVLRGEDGFRQVQKVCDMLKQSGCKVNLKCGLHVHVGANGWSVETFKNLMRLYASAEKAIDTFMAPSRRESANAFCKALRVSHGPLDAATNMDEVVRACGQSPGRTNVRGSGRYYKVNLQSYWQHGTIEFRQHQGTIEADKTLNWVKLCLRMSLAAIEGTRAADSFDALFAAVKAPDGEKSFFKGRADFFSQQMLVGSRRMTHTLADIRARARAERERQIARDRVLAQAQNEGTVQSFSPVAAEHNPFEQTGVELGIRSTARRQI